MPKKKHYPPAKRRPHDLPYKPPRKRKRSALGQMLRAVLALVAIQARTTNELINERRSHPMDQPVYPPHPPYLPMPAPSPPPKPKVGWWPFTEEWSAKAKAFGMFLVGVLFLGVMIFFVVVIVNDVLGPTPTVPRQQQQPDLLSDLRATKQRADALRMRAAVMGPRAPAIDIDDARFAAHEEALRNGCSEAHKDLIRSELRVFQSRLTVAEHILAGGTRP